jgi:hypothetical protein
VTRYAIEDARMFDAEQLIAVRTVEVEGARIVAVGAPVPAAAEREAVNLAEGTRSTPAARGP